MKKINFANNDAPYLSAENFNQMQDDIELACNGITIWKNNNPTNDFAQQTLNLDLSNYDMVEIWCRHFKSDMTSINFKIIKGYSRLMQFADYDNALASRNVVVNDTSIVFEKAQYYKNGTAIHQDARLIPIYIIGYKTGLFN